MITLHFRWCYEREMGKFISIAYVGGTFGTAVTYPLGGLILEKFSWQVNTLTNQ